MPYSTLYTIEILDNTDTSLAPPIVSEIKEIILKRGNHGRLEFEGVHDANNTITRVRPLFDVHSTNHMIPAAMTFPDVRGIHLVRCLEKLWGLQEDEFFEWFHIW